jgi:16S rRNA (guanine966-N2)-methyltransferase
MRIIGGEHGGRRLVTPKGDRTRPTSDRAREGMFSSLQTLIDLEGARVLDLYAGSGALGLEAISRGAAEATLVDKDVEAVRALTRNAEAISEAADVVPEDVLTFLERPASPYQLVVLDPPYELDADPVLRLLQPWLDDDAIVVLERRTRGPAPVPPEWLLSERSRRYGEATLWYFRAAERAETRPPDEGV